MPGVRKTMEEFKAGQLHSGSKKGPVVKNRKQAIAIGLSEARKAGEHVPKKRGSDTQSFIAGRSGPGRKPKFRN